MKLKFSFIARSLISLILIMTVIFSGNIIRISVAEGNITSQELFVGDKVGVIDGKDYVLDQSNFLLNYKIKNGTEKGITQIQLEETLFDENGRVVSGGDLIDTKFRIESGQEKTLQGNKFRAQENVTAYTLEYTIQCFLEGEESPTLISGGRKRISVLSTGVSVVYKASTGGPIAKGEEVNYTFEIESKANIGIKNISVRDSVLGDIGLIPLLSPGETASLSKAFKLDETVKSYPIIAFGSPMEGQGKIEREFKNASIEVEVEEKQVEEPLAITGKTSKTKIAPNEEVDFSLVVENKGNRVLTNVKVTDWAGKEILSRDSLEPGREYTFKAVGVEEGTNRTVQAFYSARFVGIEVGLEISNRVTPEEIIAGDTVIIEYTLVNSGKTTMVDVIIQEPQFGQVESFDELQPGQMEVFSIEKTIEGDTISLPKVYAKDKDSGYAYIFEGEFIEITPSAVEGPPLLTIRLTSDPETLIEAGEVDLICTIKNEGDVKIDNIELVLNERELNFGSILTLESGEEETITLPGLSVEEDSTFTVTVKGITYKGEEVEFTSEAYEIRMGENIPKEPVKNPKLDFLKKLLGIVLVLVVATIGGLVYLLRDLKRGKIKKKSGPKKPWLRRKSPKPKE